MDIRDAADICHAPYLTDRHALPRIIIVWAVLGAAKDAGDHAVVAACRRLIRADTIGWRKHAEPADKRLVAEFARDHVQW